MTVLAAVRRLPSAVWVTPGKSTPPGVPGPVRPAPGAPLRRYRRRGASVPVEAGVVVGRLPLLDAGDCGLRRFERVDGGSRRKQRFGVGVRRVVKYLVTGSGLDHPPAVHHRYPIGDVADHRQVMGDQYITQPQLLLEIEEEVEYLGLDR